jgi:hypothetical protein
VRAEPVGGEHGQLGVRHADVHVQRERRFPAGEHPQALVQQLVAGSTRHLGFLAQRERMGTGRGGAQPERQQLVVQRHPQRVQLGGRGAHRVVHAGGELERAGVRLGADMFGQPRRESGEEAVDALRERPPVRLEQHHLLLDAHGPGRAGGVGVP